MSEDKRVLGAGQYVGTIEDYGISESKESKAPQAFVKFKIMKGEGDGFAELTWFGGFSNEIKEGNKKSPAQWTVSTLLDCGFSGQEVEDLSTGPEGKTLELGKEMSLVVEDNDYKGVVRSRIKWVNRLGAGGPKKVSKDELSGKMNTSALRAMLLKGRENMPPQEEDIPF